MFSLRSSFSSRIPFLRAFQSSSQRLYPSFRTEYLGRPFNSTWTLAYTRTWALGMPLAELGIVHYFKTLPFLSVELKLLPFLLLASLLHSNACTWAFSSVHKHSSLCTPLLSSPTRFKADRTQLMLSYNSYASNTSVTSTKT